MKRKSEWIVPIITYQLAIGRFSPRDAETLLDMAIAWVGVEI